MSTPKLSRATRAQLKQERLTFIQDQMKKYDQHQEDLRIEIVTRELVVAHILNNRSVLQYFPVTYAQSLLRLLDEARATKKD